MQIRISTRHGNLSEETQAKVTAKAEKLSRYFERLTEIEIAIDLERREEPTVDLRVSAEHKHDFVATQQGELFAALDQVVHKVEQQLRKYKERIQDHHRTPAVRESGSQEKPESSGG